jgi:hypothetical protein
MLRFSLVVTDGLGGEKEGRFWNSLVGRRGLANPEAIGLRSLGRCSVARRDDRIEHLQKLRHSGARDDYGIAPTMRLLADAEKAPAGILAEIHREVLALHLKLAAGNDVFHGQVCQQRNWEARPDKKSRFICHSVRKAKSAFLEVTALVRAASPALGGGKVAGDGFLFLAFAAQKKSKKTIKNKTVSTA